MGAPSFLVPHSAVLGTLIGVILALFVVGAWQWWRAYARLGRELTAAKRVAGLQRPSADAGTMSLLLGKDESFLAGQLATQMLRHSGLAFARPADVVDPLVDQVRHAGSTARAIPNLLLLFGLISTVFGLMLTLISLGPDIQSSIRAGDPAGVANNLGRTLQEMSSAFAGTFWGVSTAFALQVANVFTARRARDLTHALDELNFKLAPLLYPASSEKQLQSLQELMDRSGTFLRETQEAIRKTSEDFSAVLTRSGTAIEQSLAVLQRTSQDVSTALKQASGDVKLSSERLGSAVEAMQQHKADYHNIYTQFNEMFERSMTALAKHSAGQLGEIRELHQEFGTTGAQIVDQIFKTGEKLHQVSSDLSVSQSVMTSTAGEIYTSLRAGFDALQTRLDGTLGTYTAEVNAVSESLTALRSDMSANAQASVSLERTLQSKNAAEQARAQEAGLRDTATQERLAALSAHLQAGVDTLLAVKDAPAWEGELRSSLEARRVNDEALQAVIRAEITRLSEGLAPVQQAARLVGEQWPLHCATLQDVRNVLHRQLELTGRLQRSVDQVPGPDLLRVQQELSEAVQRLNVALTPPEVLEAGPAA